MAGSKPRKAEASALLTNAEVSAMLTNAEVSAMQAGKGKPRRAAVPAAGEPTAAEAVEPAFAAKPGSMRKPKLRRAEKAEANRRALIYAAVEVIGECGYNGASIGRITEKAGLASGTFYIYFDSRQALFDILLPEIALDALQYLAPFVHGSADLLELEERGLSGVVQWDQKNPGFSRLRSEAEVAAPVAFQTYLQEILSRYIPALERGQSQGYLPGYEPRELTVIAYMLMGARHYLNYSFDKNGMPPKWVVETYMRFVRGGMLTGFAGSAKAPGKRRRTKLAAE